MTSSHLPRKPAKIRRKNRSQFQIVGIRCHAKTRVIAWFSSSEFKKYRTDVIKTMHKEVIEFMTALLLSEEGAWINGQVISVRALNLPIMRELHYPGRCTCRPSGIGKLSRATTGYPHQRYLDEIGPAVTNVNFSVDDAAHAEAVIAAEGGRTLTRFAMC